MLGIVVEVVATDTMIVFKAGDESLLRIGSQHCSLTASQSVLVNLAILSRCIDGILTHDCIFIFSYALSLMGLIRNCGSGLFFQFQKKGVKGNPLAISAAVVPPRRGSKSTVASYAASARSTTTTARASELFVSLCFKTYTLAT